MTTPEQAPAPQWQEFDDRSDAERYARETGLPLGRRRPGYEKLLAPFFVGRFSPYHYDTVTLAPRSDPSLFDAQSE